MKFYSHYILLLLVFFSLFAVNVAAQTISVTNFDPGPYSPGSSIAVPFHIDNSSGNCLSQTNTFNLFLSDANGVYPAQPLATVTGFYATFINATIKPGTPAGTGYKVKVTSSSNPGATIVESSAFTITAGATIQAGINSNGTTELAPGVFGKCDRTAPTLGFDFVNASTAGTTGSVKFIDERDGSASIVNALDGQFTAAQTNYTAIVKVTNGSVYSTKAYTLINNPVNNNLGSSASASACLPHGGSAILTYTIDVDALKLNYPGNTYKVTWGDGSTTIYTLCQIINAGKMISHTYINSSCGHDVSPEHTDVYEVAIQPVSPFCSLIGTVSSSYASISTTPTNSIGGPVNVCAGVQTLFRNGSDPGHDPNSPTCADYNGARYNWYLDDINSAPVLPNVPKGTNYTPTLTAGLHTIYLRLIDATNITSCSVDDARLDICVQQPPTPTFDITTPDPVCLINNNASVNVTNTTAVPAGNCYINPFSWKVTRGSTIIATVNNNANPTFTFNTPGVYTITLTVTDACATDHTTSKQIIVNGPPVAAFSGATSFCGPQPITFDNSRITYTGTAPGAPATYSWSVTPQGGASPATFTNGTAASQYPQINFPSVGDYTVSVTYTNSCGISVPVSKVISIKQAPTINAGATHTTVCVGDPVNLTSSITASAPYTIQWSDNGAGGTFSPNNTVLSPVYTPRAGTTGSVRLTISVLTASLPAPCNTVTADVPIVISPPPSGSNSAEAICSGSTLNHTISSSNSDDTYTWAVNPVTVNNVANYTASGNGPLIQDNLTLVNPAVAGTVTYTITPTNSNGCIGTTFNYTVTVNPLPVITLPANVTLCSGTAVNTVIDLVHASSLPNTKYTWTATASSTNITGSSNNNNPVNAAGNINDVLINSGTTAGTVTYIFTPISANGCPGTASAPVVVSVQPPPTQADANTTDATAGNSNDPICHDITLTTDSYSLKGNTPAVGTGIWTVTPSAGITFDVATNPTTMARGLIPGNTYQFTWTITSCSLSTSSTVTVKDNPASVGGTASATTPVCVNSTDQVTLSGAVGSVQNWQTSIDNGTTWTDIPNTASPTYTYTNLLTTTAFRAVVKSGSCNVAFSIPVTVTVTQGITQNTISISSTAAEVCYNTAPPQRITGSTPQGGDGTYTYKWQQSIDNINYTDITGISTVDYQPAALTVTTYFRRVVTSGICTGNTSSISSPVMIKVDPAIQATFTATVTTSCPPFNIGQNNNIRVITDPDPNVTYKWSINDGTTTQQFTGPNFPGYTISAAGQTVIVTLVATNALGCQKTTSVTFTTSTQITAVLALNTPSAVSGCANAGSKKFTVVFKNMSTPSGGNFIWDFGDGSPIYIGPDLQLSHDFAASSDGSDKIYSVTLSPQSSCTNNISSTQVITVYPDKPVPSIEIDQTDGCSGASIVVHNKTLGTNNSYTYFLRDANNSVVQTITTTNNNKSDVAFSPVFAPDNFVTYTVTMTAVNLCGVSATSNIQTLTVSPSNISATMSVTPIQQSTHTVTGCAPFQVTFHNTSFGGTAYTYHIFKDGVQQPSVRDDRSAVDYTFLEPGTYTVSLNVSSTCATGVESAPVTITVNALPAPDFTASTTTCSQPFVQFTNNTVNENNLPANSYSYLWDFGDGTTSDQFTPPPHNYSANRSPYTVKLTATNNNGCSLTTTKVDYVVVNAPPGTDFAVRPDTVISIPNYRFSFEDRSASAVSWIWDFGDNTTSTERNPAHTYADTGTYKVTLVSTSAAGCSDSKVHYVHITGVPGQLYVPNAFMPTSLNTELRVFTVKGSGIKQWDMRIYNGWGQLIFETTKLNDRGEPVEFWDGRYKGQEVQQGGYAWEISATFINGTDWRGMSYKSGSTPKKAGIVNLIR